MIRVIKGDLLDYFNDHDGNIAIGHCVNCRGVMGAGIAKDIKRMFPEAFNEYIKKVRSSKAGGFGDVSWVEVGEKRVFNLHGQYGYGRGERHLDYDAFRSSLTYMRGFHKGPIALPYGIGCGLAGGDWGDVSNIIEDTLGSDGVVYVKKG